MVTDTPLRAAAPERELQSAKLESLHVARIAAALVLWSVTYFSAGDA